MMIRLLALVALSSALSAPDQVGQKPTQPSASETLPTRIVALQYPRLAHLAGVQGRVQLEALVSAEGAANEVKTISGHSLLADAAINSLRRWRFKPCAPAVAQCSARATFVFVLEDGMCDLDRCPNEIQIDLPATVTITSKRARAIIN